MLVALYLVVAAATTSWAPGRLRPLFDGFGSHPGQYNWVSPPREFAEGNQKPESASGDLRFDGAGSTAMSTGPGDGQATVSLAPGVVAPHPPDTEGAVSLTPVDPAKLGPLPAGLRPEGNAYRVEIEYASGLKVVALATPGTIGLTSAAPADTLLYSAAGTTWETLAGQPLPTNNGITGPLAATGYYLAAAKGALREAGSSSSGSSPGGKVVLIIVGALAVPAALAWLLRSRRRPAPSRARPAGGRARPGATSQRPGAKGGAAKGKARPGQQPKGARPDAKGTARGKKR